MFSKIFLLLICILLPITAITLEEKFSSLSSEVLANYNIQIKIAQDIEKDFENFDSFNKDEEIEFLQKVITLVPSNIKEIIRDYNSTQRSEYIVLNAPLLNYQAYIYLDKFSYNYKLFKRGLGISKILYEVFPTNIAYVDTYLWGLVKDNQYEKALELYPNLIEISNNNQEIISHYNYLLDKTKFNAKDNLKKIKDILIGAYLVKDKDYFKKLLIELYNIESTQKSEFISQVNHTLDKYTYGEVQIIENKKIKKDNNDIKSLEYYLENEILYIKPNYFYKTVYKDMKKVINENTYNKIVLDLRQNEGGVLNSIVDTISAFYKDEYNKRILIVQTINNEDAYYTKKDLIVDNTTPLDILIDEQTKKGALYIPSILQKYKRVKVIGKYSEFDTSVRTYYSISYISKILLEVKIGQTLGSDMEELEISN